MGLFGPRKAERPDLEQRVVALEQETRRLASAIRLLEGEQITLHDQARRWMRRGVAAERAAETAAERARGGLPHPPGVPTVTPPAPSRLTMRGARARILARRLAEQAALATVPDTAAPEETNGVHP